MAGINLSQSRDERIGKEEKKGRIFDSGFVISIILFSLVLLGWGGLSYYLSVLDNKIALLDNSIADKNQELEGEAVGRIADFNMRMGFIAKNAKNISDPDTLFSQLESLMVPSVTLLHYEYNKQDSLVTFKAKTDNFKHIAEQIISLKSIGRFSDVKVDTIDRDKDGFIVFILKAQF